MATPTAADRRAAQKWGRKLEQAGVRYTNPITGKPLSGAALLLKTASGESGFNDDATSSAGARGRLQFMPGTRQAVLKATGGKVDPYGSIDDAYHAAYLHLAGKLGHRKGLPGYNPGGGQEYVDYILGQKVGSPGKGRPASPSSSSSSSGGDSSSPRTVNIPSAVVQSDTDSGSALALIQAMSSQSQQKAAPSSMGVAAPAFAAGPAGGQTLSVQGGGGPGPKGPDISALLSAVASVEQGGTQQVGEGQTVTVGGAQEPAPAAAPSSPKGGGSRGIPFNTTKGGYQGSQTVATSLAAIGKELGLKSTSEKRDNQNPYSGKGSDHEASKKNAYAYDLSNGSQPTPEMDRAAFRIMRALGFKDYKMGQPINTQQGVVRRGNYRIQVIYRGDGEEFGGNHKDHVHVGVERIR